MNEYCRCDAGFEEKTTILNKQWHGELFIIEDVPVLVCKKCGERFYEAHVLKQIEKMLKERKIDRNITVPVVRYKAA